jgi:hypothetical protein
MINLIQVLQEILDGEQNRYGEVEYRLPEKERIARIDLVTNSLLGEYKLNLEEEDLLSSCIFWGLYDTPIMVEHFTISFLPLILVPSVRKGFARRFETSLSFDSRIGHTYATFKDIQNFELDHKAWISLALENLATWSQEEKNHPEYKKLIETLLRAE